MLSRLALNLLTMVAHAGLKLILLPQPPECWDYKHESSHLFQSLVNHGNFLVLVALSFLLFCLFFLLIC
jgi:hypothetical protein